LAASTPEEAVDELGAAEDELDELLLDPQAERARVEAAIAPTTASDFLMHVLISRGGTTAPGGRVRVNVESRNTSCLERRPIQFHLYPSVTSAGSRITVISRLSLRDKPLGRSPICSHHQPAVRSDGFDPLTAVPG
jgi:hypothetical protein